MEHLEMIGLWVHVVAGTLTLVVGPLAIFYNFKNRQRHRQAGKVFFYAMVIVCATAVAGYFKRPELVFFQFLLGIAMTVMAGVLRGVRAVHFMQGGRLRRWDWIYTAVWGVFGAWMLGMAGWHFSHGTMIAFPILFTVFGGMAVWDTFRTVQLYRQPEITDRMTWYRLHVSTMLGAFTASTTAFTVNAAHFLPWYLQWFGPTLLLVPLQFYFGRQLSGKKTTVTPLAEG